MPLHTLSICLVNIDYCDVSLYIADVVEVKFHYDAERPDELTLHVGDIIKNCKLVEHGWLKGELNGKQGVFPANFVVKKAPPGMYNVCIHIYAV